MHSKFTDIQKADVIAQYWRGKPVTKICEEFAVSKSTVYAWIRPCSVKKEAAAVGRHVFIQKEMVNLQNKIRPHRSNNYRSPDTKERDYFSRMQE